MSSFLIPPTPKSLHQASGWDNLNVWATERWSSYHSIQVTSRNWSCKRCCNHDTTQQLNLSIKFYITAVVGEEGVHGYPGSSHVDTAWHFTSPCWTCDCRSPFLLLPPWLATSIFWTQFYGTDLPTFEKVGLSALLFFFSPAGSFPQFTSQYSHWVTLKPKSRQNSFSVPNAVTQHKLQLHRSQLHCWQQGECICAFSFLNLYSTATFP